jgi:CRP/FNR family transcriptional regulator, polysaccharide utilization system transcription regulator
MKKILVIEDNMEMRENIVEILELANYTVFAAENGRKGIEQARENLPDLILCDIMMPEIDGYGVLYFLGKDPKTSGIPFIFLSAKADQKDIRKGMRLGADDYLTKPFEEMELLEAIETRLHRNQIVRKEFSADADGLYAFLDQAKGVDSLKKLSEDRKSKKWKRKETIYNEGEMPSHLYLLTKGKVKTWRMNEDAKELIIGLHKPGEFLGYLPLLNDCAYTESATALDDTEVAVIPKEDFLALVKADRDVAVRFIRLLANDVQEKEEKLLSLAYSSVRARVAEALLHLRDRYQDGGKAPFSISISRDDLAGIVGTATESLIRTLSEFKHEHLLEISGREITILNPAGLEQVKQYY